MKAKAKAPTPAKPDLRKLKRTKYHDVVPKISDADYDTLYASIEANGCLQPIEIDADNNVLDGHNRLRAIVQLQSIGVTVKYPTPRVRTSLTTDAAKRSYVRTVNFSRRHMNNEDKRTVIGEELKANPQDSNNAIAKRLGVSDKTVAKVRQHLESTSDFPKSETRKGADGRTQPAKRAKKDEVETAADPQPRATRPKHDAGEPPTDAFDEAAPANSNQKEAPAVDARDEAEPAPALDPVREAVRTLLLAVYDEEHFARRLDEEKASEGRDFDRDLFDEDVDRELINMAQELIDKIAGPMAHWQLWQWLGLKPIKQRKRESAN